MSFEKLVESRIRESLDAGAFIGLRGEGQPLKTNGAEALAGDDWMGFHILQSADALPVWLLLGREIEHDLLELQHRRERYRRLYAAARRSGKAETFNLDLEIRREAYRALAIAIRRKQDQFNLSAPGRLSERPGLWVEYEVAKLDEYPDSEALTDDSGWIRDGHSSQREYVG